MSFAIEADVAVFGAGSAGCCAAIAAARGGARTVLVDRLGFPGGTSTAVLDTFYAFFTAGEAGRKVVSGLPDEPVARLRERGVLTERPNSFGSGTGYTYDPEALKIVWTRLLAEAGVTLMLHTIACEASVGEDGAVSSVTVANKAGLGVVRAKTIVDATGDADVVTFAGGAQLDDSDARQPATLTFRMGDVDVERFRREGRPRLPELLPEGRAAGLHLPGSGGSLHGSGAPGVVLTALTRVEPPRYDDPLEAGRVEVEGLQQIDDWTTFLTTYMPGFERAHLSAIGAMTGVRETRRVRGRHVLTEEDVLAGRQFDDQVALCGAPIEDLASETTRWEHVGGSGTYGIPWRCLLPEGLGGVVVAGRCLSATHAAHASARSMGTCMALGQAAGTAAAMAAKQGIAVADVPAGALQDALTAAGATLQDA